MIYIKAFLEELKNKYNYEDVLLDLLDKAIPTMIEYYGEEYKERILSIILETPIIISDKKSIDSAFNDYKQKDELKDELERLAPKNIDDPFERKNDDDLSLVGSVYCYEFDLVNGKPICKKVIINSSNLDYSDVGNIDNLIGVLCYAIKSNYYIDYENGKIRFFSGLSYQDYTITDGDVKEYGEKKIVGLENALNTIDKINIMKKFYNDYKSTSNYTRLAGLLLKTMYKNDELVKIIKQSQLNNDLRWKDYLGEDISNELIDLCDRHNDYLVNKLFELINNEDMKKEVDDIEKRISEIVTTENNVK